MQQRPAADGI
jgi:serine/threonine protein kinase